MGLVFDFRSSTSELGDGENGYQMTTRTGEEEEEEGLSKTRHVWGFMCGGSLMGVHGIPTPNVEATHMVRDCLAISHVPGDVFGLYFSPVLREKKHNRKKPRKSQIHSKKRFRSWGEKFGVRFGERVERQESLQGEYVNAKRIRRYFI